VFLFGVDSCAQNGNGRTDHGGGVRFHPKTALFTAQYEI
jgi:hypothetical protein